MLGLIKHGEKEEEVVNLNCKVSLKPMLFFINSFENKTIQIHHLLNYIRKKCEFKEDLELDLCDMNDRHYVKHLNENQEIYANTILKDREEFVLVKLESKYAFKLSIKTFPQFEV